jgi:hypothetical protein
VPLQRPPKNGRWVKANLEIFENSAKHGYVTGNQQEPRLGSQQWILPHHQALATAPCSHERWVCETPVPQRVQRALARRGGRQPARLLGLQVAVGNADNRGECLHTSESTHGPQRGAKTGLHHGYATQSSKNQDPAQKSHVGVD